MLRPFLALTACDPAAQIRELEKKAEVQSLRHEELMLEMSSLKKQNKYKNSQDGSPDGTITPGEGADPGVD